MGVKRHQPSYAQSRAPHWAPGCISDPRGRAHQWQLFLTKLVLRNAPGKSRTKEQIASLEVTSSGSINGCLLSFSPFPELSKLTQTKTEHLRFFLCVRKATPSLRSSLFGLQTDREYVGAFTFHPFWGALVSSMD